MRRVASIAVAGLLVLNLTAPAQEPGAAPVKMDLLEALRRTHPFPRAVDLPEEILRERFVRQVVTPQGKRAYGFSLLLPKGDWKETPTGMADLEGSPGPLRLLAATRDLAAAGQMYLTVDYCRIDSIVDPLEVLEHLAGNGGWLLLGRQIHLRQEGTVYVRVPNILALLPVDPRTGERGVARAAIRMEGNRAFVAVLGVGESHYARVADEMALAALSFDLEERTPGYAEPLRPVPLRNGVAAGRFEVGESWIVRENAAANPDVAGVGLELAAGDSHLIGAMGVFLYPRSAYRTLELQDRVRTVQGFVGGTTGAKIWTRAERIEFVASRTRGPREGIIEVYRADLSPAQGEAVPRGLELRIAWLENDAYRVLVWVYSFSQRGDRAGHAVARRAFSTVMDTLELE